MATQKKKIAVIGGGAAGVGCVVALLEEGLDPVCFEKTDKLFGTWSYKEETQIGVASIMPSTIINHSKEIGAISNFPPRKELPNYMKHHQLFGYFMEYANKYGVPKHVKYNTEAVMVKRAEDYDDSGRWVVAVRTLPGGVVTTEVFDGVLVCVGHVNRPKMPSYPDQDKFQGTISHTHSLKSVEKYRGKNVVIVGMGCSGLDAAVEISNVAKQVYLSTRSGAHVISRVGTRGWPVDINLLRRWIVTFLDIVPLNWMSHLFEAVVTDKTFGPKLYTVPPDHRIMSKSPVLNDHIASKLLSGSVIQTRNIERFVEDGVVFEGDSEVTKADAVVMATGYTWGFPFLEEGTVVKEGDRFNLYMHMFPRHLSHATLAIMGFALVFGPGFAIGELQCRWAAQVLAGKCKLPSQEEMLEDIEKRYEWCCKRYEPDDKRAITVEYMQYCDELASKFGAKPNFLKILFTDPSLFLALVFGPCLSYQYRLQGPHSWSGARDAIMTWKERVMYPLNRGNKVEPQRAIGYFLRKVVEIIYCLIY